MNIVRLLVFLVNDNWLQVDIGHPTRVTALVTKGRGDRGEQWVTKYVLAFSNDTRLWVYYNDAQRTEPKVISKHGDTNFVGSTLVEYVFRHSAETMINP